jgi:formylglycine-generating enzyme required for sulfatase activity/tRNA A-37 threonylcarbamoyl transferase component Bud32
VSVLEPGVVFGRDFRIVRALRQGGMGAVYIADQLSTGKQRALKVMAPELASDAATRERFVLEARAAAKIESDHVVEIVTAGVDDETGAPYLVMELLRGEDLADALERLGPLPLGDVAEVLAQVGHALEQAHVQGIVHRDLKPENIFLAASRRRDVAFTAKILDFGIAKLVEENMAKTGTQPLGTPLFMAPEQTDRRGKIRPATDVWALGLIAFKLIVGKDFWMEADGSLAMLLREVCVDPIPFATARLKELSARAEELGQRPLPELPPGFDAWFARCVTRDVDARFADAGEAMRAFGELVAPDAPRGALVASGGAGDTGVVGAKSIAVTPSATKARTAVDPNAATRAVTGTPAASASTGTPTVQPAPEAPAKRTSPAAMAGIAAVVVIGGVFGIRALTREAPPAPAANAPSLLTSAPAASAAPIAAEPAGSCPAGTVLITGAKLFMGARDLTPDTKPPHEVTLSSFCLDKTEVTTRAYLACVEKGECERPPSKVSWPGITPAQEKLYSGLCNADQKDRLDHPINCVAWAMADNFCKKRGARLPTEAEWELAARGSVQRRYPWGDEPPSPKLLNACGAECTKWFAAAGERHSSMYEGDDGFSTTAPVGSFPAGASAAGVLDLAGNVWEWTADWYAPYSADPAVDPRGPATGTQRVVRGGDFTGFQADWARPAYRWKTDPDTFNHAIGFRCAAAPK